MQSQSEMQSKKKNARPHILTRDQEESVVEWLKSNDCLFNIKLHAYKDTADELQIETTIFKTWLDNMQTRFGKITKTASGFMSQYTERDQWILDRFDFVQQHIVRIKGRKLMIMKVLSLLHPSCVLAAHNLPLLLLPRLARHVPFRKIWADASAAAATSSAAEASSPA